MEAYDINKQTIYIAPTSKIDSRAHYAAEPARGLHHKNDGSNANHTMAPPAVHMMSTG